MWLSVAAIKIRKTMLAQLTADSCRGDIVGAIVIALHSRSRGKRYSLYTSGLANYRADTRARRGEGMQRIAARLGIDNDYDEPTKPAGGAA